jgi:hypothetical protein
MRRLPSEWARRAADAAARAGSARGLARFLREGCARLLAMRVYVLHFRGAAALTRAFDRVMESRHVASCLVEPESGRIRFLAPRRAADAIVEVIYGEGGLTWCSRHDLRVPQAESRAPHASVRPLR